MRIHTAGLCFLAVLAVLLSGCSSTSRSLPVTEFSPSIFDGPKPRSRADFLALREHGIRTIVSLQWFPWDVEPERKRAREYGMEFRNVPIQAVPWGPSEAKVKALLQMLATPQLRPIYVHCLLGRDRTAVMLALYRVYYEDCTPEIAWEEMVRHGGFKSSWGLVGFKMYYWRHCKKPDWAKAERGPAVKPAAKPGFQEWDGAGLQ